MGKTVQRNRGEVVSVLRDRRNWPLQNVRVPVMIFIRKTGAIYIFGDAPDSREVIQQFAQKPSSSRARRTSRTWKSCSICSRTTRMCRTPTTTGRPRTKPYIARVSAVLKPLSCDIQGSSCDMHNNLCCDIQRGLFFSFLRRTAHRAGSAITLTIAITLTLTIPVTITITAILFMLSKHRVLCKFRKF